MNTGCRHHPFAPAHSRAHVLGWGYSRPQPQHCYKFRAFTSDAGRQATPTFQRPHNVLRCPDVTVAGTQPRSPLPLALVPGAWNGSWVGSVPPTPSGVLVGRLQCWLVWRHLRPLLFAAAAAPQTQGPLAVEGEDQFSKRHRAVRAGLPPCRAAHLRLRPVALAPRAVASTGSMCRGAANLKRVPPGKPCGRIWKRHQVLEAGPESLKDGRCR